MTGNDHVAFVDDDDADKAELADARRQQVDLALGMLAGIMRSGFRSPTGTCSIAPGSMARRISSSICSIC